MILTSHGEIGSIKSSTGSWLSLCIKYTLALGLRTVRQSIWSEVLDTMRVGHHIFYSNKKDINV